LANDLVTETAKKRVKETGRNTANAWQEDLGEGVFPYPTGQKKVKAHHKKKA